MRNKYLLFFTCFFILFSSFSQDNEQQEDLRIIVTLLDYVSKDYKVAVENGIIVNETEYIEQQDFLKRVAVIHSELVDVLHNKQFVKLKDEIDELSVAINEIKTSEEISAMALSIKNEILDLGILKVSPSEWPSLSNGRVLYEQSCASCHGVSGKGDGAQGMGLDPEPTNFLEEENAVLLSPFQAYNVIKLGVEGTAMTSFDGIYSESEIWDLAFYVVSIRHENDNILKNLPSHFSLDNIVKWSDKELGHYLKEENESITIGQIRTYEPERIEPLSVAQRELDLSYKLYKSGDIKQSYKHALRSYLEGIELVENLISSVSPNLTLSIERNMINYRKAIQSKNTHEVEKYYQLLKKEISEARQLLSRVDFSFAFIFGASLSILLREALEALLIILIIISILKPLKIKRAITAVHFGWITAVALGFAAWIFIDYLVHLSGSSRELMEGIGSIIAVLVLLYAGAWLHAHSEAEKWTQFIKIKIHKIKDSGNLVALSAFSFIVVFREVIEVVLFLSSLKLKNPEVADKSIIWALLVSTVVIAIFTFIFLKTTKRLPITVIFKLSAFIISILTVTLSGKGIMALQESGIIAITPLNFIPKIEILGVFPNVQAIGTQLVVLVIIILLARKSTRQKKIDIGQLKRRQ